MLDPRDWKYEHRLRLLIATAFGALLGFTHGYSHGSFNLLVALIGAAVVGGAFYCYRAFLALALATIYKGNPGRSVVLVP
jgi:hypothetical protein